MRFILHIGQSKTGTSSLQKFLSSNRENLTKQGILYPDIYLANMPVNLIEHNSIADSTAGFRRYPGLSAEEYFDQFRQQAKKSECHTILLSGENFFGGLPQIWDLPEDSDYYEIYENKLKKLKSCLGQDPCDVIVYLRRQDQWLDSVIAHAIRYEGLSKNLQYQSDEQMVDLLMPRLDYSALLEIWENIIAPNKLQVIPYEKEEIVDGNIISDFIKRTALNEDLGQTSNQFPEEHESLSCEFIELKKKLNPKIKSKTEQRAINIILTKLNEETGSNAKYRMKPDLKKEVLAKMKESNKNLTNKYGEGKTRFFAKTPDTEKLTQEPNIKKTEQEFYKRWQSPHTRWLLVKLETKRILRNRAPLVHTLTKNIKNRFGHGRA